MKPLSYFFFYTIFSVESLEEDSAFWRSGINKKRSVPKRTLCEEGMAE